MTKPGVLERDACRIAWERLGAQSGAATAVLLHGFGTSRDAMRPLASRLLERGAVDRALLVDLRGHGETDAPPRDEAHRYDAMRDDAIAVVAEQVGSPAHWIGHSMGGQIALLVAFARPELVCSLSLLGAGPCRAVTEAREQRSWQRAALAFERAGTGDLAAMLAAAAPTRHEALAPERLYGTARGEDLARIVRGAFLTLESNDEACRQLRVPTLLIAGSEDAGWLAPTRRLAELVPGSTLRIAAGAGHLVHLEEPDACARWIAEQIRSLQSRGEP